MPCAAPWLLLAALAGSPGAAAPHTLSAGGRAGVHWPPQPQLSAGGQMGVAVELALLPLVSLGLLGEASSHVLTTRTGPRRVLRAGGGVFGRYRLDVTRVVPYFEGAALAHQLQLGGQPTLSLSAAAAVGLHVPFASLFYVEAQVGYGYAVDSGRFPSGVSLVLGLGWRSRSP